MAKLCPFRLATVYNVMDYGAHADGTTDDVEHINAAITAAYDAGGGVVYMPAGTYMLYATTSFTDYGDTTSILLKEGVHLRGAGQGVTILKNTRALSQSIGAHFVSNVGCSYLTTYQTGAAYQTADGTKFHCCSNVTVHHVTAYDHYSGISAQSCNNVAVSYSLGYDNLAFGIMCGNISPAVDHLTPDGTRTQTVAMTDCEAYGNLRGFFFGGTAENITYGADAANITLTRCNSHNNSAHNFVAAAATGVTFTDCISANAVDAYSHVRVWGCHGVSGSVDGPVGAEVFVLTEANGGTTWDDYGDSSNVTVVMT